MDTHLYLWIVWVCVFGVILRDRLATKTIVIICGLLLSYKIIYPPEIKSVEVDSLSDEILTWLSDLIKAKEMGDIDEAQRCYHEVKNRLHADALLNKNNKDHGIILSILKRHVNKDPLPCNVANDPNYGVSVGFTSSHGFK